MTRIDEKTRKRILELVKRDGSAAMVSRRMGVTQRTVQKILRESEEPRARDAK